MASLGATPMQTRPTWQPRWSTQVCRRIVSRLCRMPHVSAPFEARLPSASGTVTLLPVPGWCLAHQENLTQDHTNLPSAALILI